MNREKIENIDELLLQEIGKGKKIVDTKTSRLTSPGENYGGLLLRIDITLEDARGKQERLHVVAKTIPVNTFLQKVFDIQVSVRKEIAVYDTVVPVLQEFERERGVSDVLDLLPKLYGARLNINRSDVVDEHSVILLENLENSGYKNVDRLVGFDLDTTKLILQNLAAFHSTALALRISKPDVFEKKIKPHLTALRSEGPPKGSGEEIPMPVKLVRDFFASCEEIRPLLPKLRDINVFHPEHEPGQDQVAYFTISHGDLWSNNIMVKFENDKPVTLKFLDFQNMALRSAVVDLLFFLITSTQKSILKTRLDELIKFYHDCFIKKLEQLKCDTTTYSFEKLLEEIRTGFKLVLGQVIFMTMFVILSKRSKSVSIEEDLSKPPDFGTVEDITPDARDRIIFILNHCNEKGWL